MKMDILQPLPFEQWGLLRDSLKRDWPTYAYYYSFLNTAMKWKKKESPIQVANILSERRRQFGTFVGISTNSYSIIYVFAFEKSKDLLRGTLKETSRINWNEYVEFPAVYSHFSDVHHFIGIYNRDHQKMDILQPLPIDEWALLRDSLRRDWPTYASYYYLINNSIKWKRKDPEFKLQFFCPNADVNAGTFVGLATQSLRMVYIFAFEESKDVLRRALSETRVIDWNQYNIFPHVHSHYDVIAKDFFDKEAENKNIMVSATVTYILFKPNDECLRLNVSVPEEYILRRLDNTHVPFVHSMWSGRSKEEPKKTIEFLAAIVRFNRGFGLFLKKDGTLVSWVLHSHWGGLGMLHTVEEHKRKGYGKVVVKVVAKKLAEEENLDSFAFIEVKNTPSLKLFESLGYKHLGSADYYYTQPKS